MFHADLHIHSKYSRACSKDCDLEHLTWWARRKGVGVVGTGDFTHPAWSEQLHEKLVPAEPGLYRLRSDLEAELDRSLPASCPGPVRFMLSVEIATIYKRGDYTRKVHHLIYVPDLDAAWRVTAALAKIGNLASDGRPILGLDSRDLLEIVLDSDPGSYLVPAHAWTPWFSVLGSKSGFDAVEDCYADLAGHIFAIETGLSSDPPMNWRISGLDRYQLVSNSDAHSPPMLAREASLFDTELDYYAIRRALETGQGYRGTAEFFPEEGKYHLDGHRKCGVRLEPPETREYDGRCPECGRPLTVGVLNRVEELADRSEGLRPDGVAGYRSLVPLPEVMGEILGVGPKTKKVAGEISTLVAGLGPELHILGEAPVEDVRRVGGPLVAEAVTRLRRGEVIRAAGYDGEYGVIRLFQPAELRGSSVTALFDMELFDMEMPPAARQAPETPRAARHGVREERVEREGHGQHGTAGAEPRLAPAPENPPQENEPAAPGSAVLDGLDPEQRRAAAHDGGPLLIVAGPGTGKTRTLTHRVAHLVTERDVPAENCLAITFTRRACEEMRERLAGLMPEQARYMTVTTFHGLGTRILREHHERAGLSASFRVADDETRRTVAAELAGSERDGKALLAGLDGDPRYRARLEEALRQRDMVDLDGLVALPVRLLSEDPELAAAYRRRYPYVSVDEYQDVDERQYELLRLVTAPEGQLTAIGDPDQAIYSFRGADVGFFLRFGDDYPSATTVQLTRNYRCAPTILSGALAAITPSSLVPGRELRAAGHAAGGSAPARIGVHQAADEVGEASFVARTIDQLLGGSSFHSLDSGRVEDDSVMQHGLSFADIAVLYRTDAQARPVMEALTRAGVPFQKRSHDRLASRPGVRFITRELPYTGGGELVTRVRDAAGTAVESLPGSAAEQAVDIRAAAELLVPLAERFADDLEGFLTELALGAEVDTWDPRADRVSLLTLHAAKGLEFPVVFVVGCENGLLPLRWPGEEPDSERDAEERRLFFVGMTRAGSRLFCSHAARRSRQGAVREMTRSPFLAALGDDVAERAGGAGARRRPKDHQLTLM